MKNWWNPYYHISYKGLVTCHTLTRRPGESARQKPSGSRGIDRKFVMRDVKSGKSDSFTSLTF